MDWMQIVQEITPGLVRTVGLLVAIVIPLTIAIELAKESGFFRPGQEGGRLSKSITRALGMSPQAAMPLAAGFFFGLAYGAGLILQYAEDGQLSRRDRMLIVIFLIGCHAVVEDTLIFVPLGVNPFFLFFSRLILAIVLTAAAARVVPSLRMPKATDSMSSDGPA